MHRHKEAEKAAREALDDPRYPNQDLAFINLGNALAGQKKFKPAIAAYQEAKVFNPNNSIISLRMADAYAGQGKLSEARALYEEVFHTQQGNRIVVEGLLAVLKQQHDTISSNNILKQFRQHTESVLDKTWAENELERINKQRTKNPHPRKIRSRKPQN